MAVKHGYVNSTSAGALTAKDADYVIYLDIDQNFFVGVLHASWPFTTHIDHRARAAGLA